MRLENYINDLLYRYECVTIPQFGAFITQSVSAVINDDNQTLYPPKKIVAFNGQLQSNDGILARYIADNENISFEAATLEIAKHVRQLNSNLEDGKTLHFENIGTLCFNADKKIEFKPSHTINYLTDAFGLSEVVSPAITREILYSKAENDTLKTVPEYALDKAVKNSATSPKERTLLKPFYKYAAAAVLVLGLTAGMGSNYINTIEEYNTLAQQKANKRLESKIQEATFIISNPLPAVNLNISKRTGRFHIVVAAHRDKENAMAEVKKLIDSGKDAWLDTTNSGYHNVIYSSYERHYKAVEALEQARLIYNEDAWLYVKDLD